MMAARAAAVALYTARASPPSTRTVAMPYPGPLPAMPSPRYCSVAGVEIAHPLLRQMKSTGEDSVDAKFNAA